LLKKILGAAGDPRNVGLSSRAFTLIRGKISEEDLIATMNSKSRYNLLIDSLTDYYETLKVCGSLTVRGHAT